MKKFKKGYDYPPKDNIKLKEMMKSVYDQKLYYEDEDSEDSERREKKPKKKHKKSRRHESSDESPREDSVHNDRPQEHKEQEKPKPKPQANLLDVFDFDPPAKESVPDNPESSWAAFIAPKASPPAPSHPETIKKESPPAPANSNPFESVQSSKPVLSSPYQTPSSFNNLPSGSVGCPVTVDHCRNAAPALHCRATVRS
eukprot:TRINITY_DN821_c0_g1_i2.p2 TRINITY_DN821_c0_g1~~TRINITY_DN821_c0_g1_i2.p2  ORF type:complete len:199 (+),score=61.92 TRINITY_DN821_c0_g1_i2:276-872(+)